MEFSARVFNPATVKVDCLVLVVAATGEPGKAASAIDEATGGLVSAALKDGELGKFLKTVEAYKPTGLAAKRLIVVSTGNKPVGPVEFAKLAAKIAAATKGTTIKSAAICLDDIAIKNRDILWGAAELAKTVSEAQYVFDQCKSKKDDHPKLAKVSLLAPSAAEADILSAALNNGLALAKGIRFARELGDLPANICTPSYLADEAQKLAKSTPGLTAKILNETQMKALSMGSLLSVTAGTEIPAKMIILEYKGGKKGDHPVVLVGKGVTFDTGGISLKPGAGMDEMKYDMCGAASVLGSFVTVTELGLPINLVGIIPAVENMPGGRATKPGDIVTSMSGQTIEILNTDAEGRLILCDALTYAERYKPKAVIDIATLTGACVVALGNHISGLFSNNDELAQDLFLAGETTGDKAWRLPMDDEFDQQLKSPFADMANIGGKGGGSITAACFLARFTKKYHWAHLDIAGTAWKSGAQKGATGRPVSLLVEYLRGQAD